MGGFDAGPEKPQALRKAGGKAAQSRIHQV